MKLDTKAIRIFLKLALHSVAMDAFELLKTEDKSFYSEGNEIGHTIEALKSYLLKARSDFWKKADKAEGEVSLSLEKLMRLEDCMNRITNLENIFSRILERDSFEEILAKKDALIEEKDALIEDLVKKIDPESLGSPSQNKLESMFKESRILKNPYLVKRMVKYLK